MTSITSQLPLWRQSSAQSLPTQRQTLPPSHDPAHPGRGDRRSLMVSIPASCELGCSGSCLCVPSPEQAARRRSGHAACERDQGQGMLTAVRMMWLFDPCVCGVTRLPFSSGRGGVSRGGLCAVARQLQARAKPAHIFSSHFSIHRQNKRSRSHRHGRHSSTAEVRRGSLHGRVRVRPARTARSLLPVVMDDESQQDFYSSSQLDRLTAW